MAHDRIRRAYLLITKRNVAIPKWTQIISDSSRTSSSETLQNVSFLSPCLSVKTVLHQIATAKGLFNIIMCLSSGVGFHSGKTITPQTCSIAVLRYFDFLWSSVGYPVCLGPFRTLLPTESGVCLPPTIYKWTFAIHLIYCTSEK